MDGFEVNRKVEIGMHKLDEIFKGLENVGFLKKKFGGDEKLKGVLENLPVRVTNQHGYMWVDEESGCICISFDYLANADERYIYLDMVHELVHIKQRLDGMKLFDRTYSYVERPTEVEAYKIAVEEAKRIGMRENEILFYLSVEWVNHEDRIKLLKALELI